MQQSLTADCSGLRELLGNIGRAISTLPRPVRRVCYVQVCAFMGWFPFLFYRCVSRAVSYYGRSF